MIDTSTADGCARRARRTRAALLLLGLWLAMVLTALTAAGPARAAEAPTGVPLVISHRTVHVFRAPLGSFTAAERAAAAQQRIERAVERPGEGWTSVQAETQTHGVMVTLDGQPMFLVLPGDAAPGSSETADSLANAASRVLQSAWRDARETRASPVSVAAVAKVLAALVLLAVLLLVLWRLTGWLRDSVTRHLAARVDALADAALASRMSPLFLGGVSRACVLLAWLLSLLLGFVFVAYALDQFPSTRAMGEGLFDAFSGLLLQGLNSVAEALPGMFVAGLIFLVAWIGTQLSSELFNQVASGRLRLGMLDQHTAPVTRYIVSAALWLFALAMAYPYLPGAQTEAFKGLSVLLGIMVSIGASGLVGQVFSGVILVYTRALSLGEYVRILDSEGTVTEIGLFVTRLRTGMGAEIALPNSLVLSNVTWNYSRVTQGTGFVLDTSVTIGYDTPWRQVHALLLEATQNIAEIEQEPAPYVVQTALSDFYVAYRLVVYVGSAKPAIRARVASDLNAAIQDMFNRYGVQIMSPGYYTDPAQPKLVPESNWYAAPARRPD